jgi:hypothetical protein
MKRMGAQLVEVVDGGGDPDCVASRNSVWSVQEALESLQGHENCIRTFVPVDAT